MRTTGLFGSANSTPLVLALSLATLTTTAHGGGSCGAVWQNSWDNYSIGPSMVTPTKDIELADDFDVEASIHRVLITSNGCNGCGTPAVTGLRVRFYAWTNAGPGALLAEYVFDADDPNLIFDQAQPKSFDFTLPQPFIATGAHFLSVQPIFAGDFGNPLFFWSWWSANLYRPDLLVPHVRDNKGNGAWLPYEFSPHNPVPIRDVNFTLYGVPERNRGMINPCGDWVAVTAPQAQNVDDQLMSSVFALASDDIWAVGSAHVDHPELGFVQYPLTTHFDGATWKLFYAPCPALGNQIQCSFKAVHGSAPDNVWAVGAHDDPNKPGSETLVERWDGEDWNVMPNVVTGPGGSGSSFHDVYVFGEDDVIAVGEISGSVQSPGPQSYGFSAHWNGSDWTVRLGPPDPEIFSFERYSIDRLAVLAPDNIWAVGNHFAQSLPSHPYLLKWNGEDWVLFEPRPEPHYTGLVDIVAFADDDVWLSAVRYQVGFVFLHWDGEDWTEHDAPGNTATFAPIAPDNMYAAIEDRLAHWDGTAWTLVDNLAACVASPKVNALTVAGPCDVWGVGNHLEGDDLRILTTRLIDGPANAPGDLDGDGVVGSADLAILLGAWGACADPQACPADLNGDDAVGSADLGVLLGSWTEQ